jgi:pimeloyl-ACP methyl ester carboxylesterase
VFDPNLGFNAQTALLAGGLVLLVWALAGGWLVRWFTVSSRRSAATADAPKHTRTGAVHRLQGADGSDLQVETYGPDDGIPIILTHGWGMNSTKWYYLKQQITDRFRLIVWDLPGLGFSAQPANKDYRLEKLARDLETVLGLAGDRPAILLGHSIGGMITLTFCRLFPAALRTRVAGLALVHTTYTNPVRTVKLAGLATALERPVIIPLLYLTIWLAPLVWLMNWLSYLNGTAHLSTKHTGFAGNETWDQVEFATSFQKQAWPAVLARGMFGMLNYDATETLQTINLPVLVVPGDRDPVCCPEASDRIHQDVPTAQLAPLAPAKHMGLLEHNQHFADLVRTFALACQPTGKTDPPVCQPVAQEL